MGYSKNAIQKGLQAEALAKYYYRSKGFIILEPEGHETRFDFVAYSDETPWNKFTRVQVKSERGHKDLVRFSNKRGGSNTPYALNDFDILVGIWEDGNEIFFFRSKDVTEENYKPELTVKRKDRKKLLQRDRVEPFFWDKIVKEKE